MTNKYKLYKIELNYLNNQLKSMKKDKIKEKKN